MSSTRTQSIGSLFGIIVLCMTSALFTPGCGDNEVAATDAATDTSKDLTAYAFLSAGNAGLAADVAGTITDTTISLTVPFGTNVTALVATFTTTGADVTVGSTSQVSGATAIDFTSPANYRVTAADGSTKDYTVTVTVAPSTAKDLTSYAFLAANNGGLAVDVAGTIAGTTISVTVPFGTNVTALVAAFTTTGASVTVTGTAQVSGATANNFTNPVIYRVTAADGSTQDYTVTVIFAPSTAKDLTSYAFLAANNGGLAADVVGTITGTTISLTVPFGTNVTALVASFVTTGASVRISATAQVSGTTANNFTSPVIYRVTAADGSTKDYTVTVTVAPANAKDLTSYTFLAADNAGLAADVVGTITGTTISLTVPFGTNVTALIATFATTGASVRIGGTIQVSGTTANDVTNPVIYRVTAADSSTKDYTVTVTVAPSTAKDLTSYAFLAADNAGLAADVIGTITGTTISVTVPFGTNVTALVAAFTTTGASVTVTGTPQVSGATANNFTSPVIYRVTAADSSTKDYTVTVTVAPGTAKDLTSYAFLAADNGGLAADVVGTITGTTISLTVPFGTNVTALVAAFTTTGASVTVTGTPQVSGATANNFTNPVIYRVTAADSSTQDYTVTVIVAPANAKDLTSYAFLAADNAGLAADVIGTITGTTISLTVPFGTNVTALVASFATTGVSVRIGGTIQVSGTTANDFTNPVIYRVTAADSSTKNYTVTVTVALNPAKEITAYAFLAADNGGLGADVIGTITGNAISLTVPSGTNVTALVAAFSTTGASVTVGATPQVSGTTANNFTNPVTYRVTAADGSTRDYVVTVTVAAMTAKDLTSFGFLSANNPSLWTDVSGAIIGTTISLTVPFGTDVTILVATFSTTGASVTVAATPQTSDTTVNDFTNPVIYRVTAADGSTKDYTVTVTVASGTAKDLTAFSFLSVNNAGLAADVTGTITGTTISLTVPLGTDITALVATFSTTGVDVSVGGMTQVSSVTANDFTATVIYTVTADDGSTKNYTVTITFV